MGIDYKNMIFNYKDINSLNQTDVNNALNNEQHDPVEMRETMLKLTKNSRGMTVGGLHLLGQMQGFKYGFKTDDFEEAMTRLSNAKSERALYDVERCLQRQIDVIRKLKVGIDLEAEDRGVCLYTLQNMIFALGEYKLGENVENNYVPKLFQDEMQMLIDGTRLGVDWDTMVNDCNTSQYSSKVNSEHYKAGGFDLSNWKFLDLDKIKAVQKEFDETKTEEGRKKFLEERTRSRNTPVVTELFFDSLNNQSMPQISSQGQLVEAATVEDINAEHVHEMGAEILRQIDVNDMSSGFKQIWNFSKDATNQNISAVNHARQTREQDAARIASDYQLLNETMLQALHFVVQDAKFRATTNTLDKEASEEYMKAIQEQGKGI